MSTFRGLPREVLGTVGLEPEGDDDEPDEPCGPYELPHLDGGGRAASGGGRFERRPARRTSAADDPTVWRPELTPPPRRYRAAVRVASAPCNP